MLAPATPTILDFTAWKMSQLLSEDPNYCVCGGGGQSPLRTLINEGTPTFVYLLFRPKGGLKAINDFSHFCGLIPDTHSKHLECFVKIGTHSELHRGQMSHICDISPPRVNYMFSELIYTSDNQ